MVDVGSFKYVCDMFAFSQRKDDGSRQLSFFKCDLAIRCMVSSPVRSSSRRKEAKRRLGHLSIGIGCFSKVFAESNRNPMWVKQCHKPPMTGNGNHTTYKWVMTGAGLWQCFTNIIIANPIYFHFVYPEKVHSFLPLPPFEDGRCLVW